MLTSRDDADGSCAVAQDPGDFEVIVEVEVEAVGGARTFEGVILFVTSPGNLGVSTVAGSRSGGRRR